MSKAPAAWPGLEDGMQYLSLFSGAGGGDLAAQHLNGWECIGYVEWDKYCQQVIAARIEDGYLANAPIFGDIRAFVSEGYAAAYTGLVDVITGGFPCQPFSNAGKQLGADDERNMWPATIDAIRIIRPRYALLENVSALLSSGYFGAILGDLAESGYVARWRILSAAELGAPHKRVRVWIVADAIGAGLEKRKGVTGNNGEKLQTAKRGDCILGNKPDWWATEPDVGRVADGVANRVDRLRAIGNGQVPLVAATAWDLLNE